MAVCNYQVFLSFRGSDTRKGFIKYFYDRLNGSGIVAFLDREEIQDGETIGAKIVEAIAHSDICVPVFSENFAASPACLMEVAQMVESQKQIRPIFFGLEPCVVRYQQGKYAESFAEHKRKNRYPESIEKWKGALREIAEKKGPVIKDPFSENEELEDFISELWKFLNMDNQGVTKNLVGIDRDVPEVMRKLGFVHEDRRVVDRQEMTGKWVVAVHGMAGVGKTTLAKEIYHRISHLFNGCAILENVRHETEQERLVSLQKELIRRLKKGDCPKVETSRQCTDIIRNSFQHMRVLILLDDVDDFEQIEPLAGELTWFGPGSTIILTTTKNNIIDHYKKPGETKDVILCYHKVSPMNEDHALELFCKRAFQQDHPLEGYHILSSQIISAVECLPLAIEVAGRYLYCKSKDIWNETPDNLEGVLEKRLEPKLKAIYDHLNEEAKEIFLDIACFFIGVEKRIPVYMWAALGWHPDTNVYELQNTSFLEIGEENEFRMKNQLKLMGIGIVGKENSDDPGQRSRLWDDKDVEKILRKKKENKKVKALHVASKFDRVDNEVFHYLSNLKFLKLDNVDMKGNCENLLPDLVWLDWPGCREKSKLFAFNMENLIILNLCKSSVKLNLKDWEQLMEKAMRLKVLNLKDCTWIIGSLEFRTSRHLECLILEGCLLPSPATQNCENLVSLNMKRCILVKHLPALCSLKALKELLIDGTEIRRLQFENGSLLKLEILSACECKALHEVTDSIKLLKNLRKLTLRNCRLLKELPPAIGELVWLEEIDLSDTSIKELPPTVKDCQKLQVLKMVRTFLKGFPEAIKDLGKLEELDFTDCRNLSGCCDITGLSSLRILRLKGTEISQVLARDNRQFCLHILELNHGVDKQTKTSQMQSSISKHKGKRLIQTGQTNSSVSKHKRKRDQE